MAMMRKQITIYASDIMISCSVRKAGNKYHYREWALEVTGVGDAKIFPRYNGPLSIKVVASMRTNYLQIPS